MIKVVAAIIKSKDAYLVARRASHKQLAGKWEFPGGKIEAGETAEIALQRELLEELGIDSIIGRHLKSVVCNVGGLIIELMAYEVLITSHDFMLTDHDKIEWITLSESESYVMSKADRFIIDYLKSPKEG